MLKAYSYVKSLITGKDEGATMIEYALMVAVIALVAVVGAGAAGASISGLFDRIGLKLDGYLP
jgi:Flp pilus assembly pilin Flp